MSDRFIYLVFGDQNGVAAFTDKDEMLAFLRSKQRDGLPVVSGWHLYRTHDNRQDGEPTVAINLKELLR